MKIIGFVGARGWPGVTGRYLDRLCGWRSVAILKLHSSDAARITYGSASTVTIKLLCTVL